MLSMEFGGGTSYGYPQFGADTVLQREQYPLLGDFLDALGVEMSVGLPVILMLAGDRAEEMFESFYEL